MGKVRPVAVYESYRSKTAKNSILNMAKAGAKGIS